LTTVTAAASTTSFLYPQNSADVTITIHNPNPYGVDVTSISGNGTITSVGNAACDAGGNGVSFADQPGTWHVNANSDADFTLPNAASMSNDSDNACQDTTFDIPVSLSGASA